MLETWRVNLCSSSFPVFAADPPGNGGFPKEAGGVLRGSEAVSAERVHPEGVFPVSLPAAPHLRAAPFLFKYFMCEALPLLFAAACPLQLRLLRVT